MGAVPVTGGRSVVSRLRTTLVTFIILAGSYIMALMAYYAITPAWWYFGYGSIAPITGQVDDVGRLWMVTSRRVRHAGEYHLTHELECMIGDRPYPITRITYKDSISHTAWTVPYLWNATELGTVWAFTVGSLIPAPTHCRVESRQVVTVGEGVPFLFGGVTKEQVFKGAWFEVN